MTSQPPHPTDARTQPHSRTPERIPVAERLVIEHRPDEEAFVLLELAADPTAPATAPREVGRIDYARDGSDWDLLHTEVAATHGGRGLAGRLVRAAADHVLAEATANGEHALLMASCSYARGWLARHSDDYRAVLSPAA